MVNEVNKPPAATTENAQLEERLANSNRQLHAMQEEHRQLLEEMQMLRQRAAELSQRNAQELIMDSHLNQANASNREIAVEVPTIERAATVATSVPTTTAVAAAVEEKKEEEEADDPETAAYLTQKLAEVAALKARLRKVQNMVDTTNLIEDHVAAKSSTSQSDNADIAKAVATSSIVANTSAVTAQFEERNEELLASMMNALNTIQHRTRGATNEGDQAESDAADPIPDENQELLSTMLNMFTDFTSDLRSQANDLRAERERIKAFKEELIRRKRGN